MGVVTLTPIFQPTVAFRQPMRDNDGHHSISSRPAVNQLQATD